MTIRPFVWIIWLLLGPVFGAIAVQWYIFTAVSGQRSSKSAKYLIGAPNRQG